MASFTNLNNERDFPPWGHLPSERQLSPVYHAVEGRGRPGTGHPHKPKRH